MVSKLVQRASVAVEDLEALGFAQRRPEGKTRIVEIPMRIIRREQQAIDADPFDQRSQVPGGWVVNQKCSRTYSDGRRLRCGTSSRKRSKCWSIRHIADEIQPKPPSMNTILRRGKRSSTPSITKLVNVAAIECAFD